MEVILLERVARLGRMGDVVRVRDGYGRNFLLPQGKALRATAQNRTHFESMKSELEARSAALKTEASAVAENLNGMSFTVLRQASEAGQLYGSVSPRDLVRLLTEAGYAVNRNQIALNVPIKMIGQHSVSITLHPEIETAITLIVARNSDEAARIARGEDVTRLREEAEEPSEGDEEGEATAAEAFFEPESAQAQRDGENAEAPANPAAAEQD